MKPASLSEAFMNLTRDLDYLLGDVLPGEIGLEREWTPDTVDEFRGFIQTLRESIRQQVNEFADGLSSRDAKGCQPSCHHLLDVFTAILERVFDATDARLMSCVTESYSNFQHAELKSVRDWHETLFSGIAETYGDQPFGAAPPPKG